MLKILTLVTVALVSGCTYLDITDVPYHEEFLRIHRSGYTRDFNDCSDMCGAYAQYLWERDVPHVRVLKVWLGEVDALGYVHAFVEVGNGSKKLYMDPARGRHWRGNLGNWRILEVVDPAKIRAGEKW